MRGSWEKQAVVERAFEQWARDAASVLRLTGWGWNFEAIWYLATENTVFSIIKFNQRGAIMDRHEVFLNLFRRLEALLRRITMEDEDRLEFKPMLRRAAASNRLFRQHKETLEAIAEMRNFLSHEVQGKYLAIPSEQAIAFLEDFLKALESPSPVIPRFQREVVRIVADAPIGKAIHLMYQHNFSQIPVEEQERTVDMLTTNTIARWLGAMVEEDVFSLQETKVKEVLAFSERDAEVWGFLHRNASLLEAMQRFEEAHQQGKRLVALLITHSGRLDEKPLGIITLWDLAALYQEVQSPASLPGWQ